MASGSKPQAMTLAWSVSWPGRTGNRAAMAWAGVRWYLPPKGISTLPHPMVESNRSASPRREAHRRLPAIPRREAKGVPPGAEGAAGATAARACFTAPLVFRKSRLRSTIMLPRQRITIRGDSVTMATGYASRFSASAAAMKRSAFSGATTTAIRS